MKRLIEKVEEKFKNSEWTKGFLVGEWFIIGTVFVTSAVCGIVKAIKK